MRPIERLDAPTTATATPPSIATRPPRPTPADDDRQEGWTAQRSLTPRGRGRRRLTRAQLLLAVAACGGCVAPGGQAYINGPTSLDYEPGDASLEEIGDPPPRATAEMSMERAPAPRRVEVSVLMTRHGLAVRGRDAATGAWILSDSDDRRIVLVPGRSAALVGDDAVALGGVVRVDRSGNIDLPSSGVSAIANALRAAPRPRPIAPVIEAPAAPTRSTRPALIPVGEVPLPDGWNRKPSRPWKAIVIHHSATDAGSAASFDRSHREDRGWSRGLGYHFVIGNGDGARDGEIEIGPRWRKQQGGAHAGAGAVHYNEHGIGICLVGNFEGAPPSAKQMAALRTLIRALSRRYEIAPKDVLPHKTVRPKPTNCPGARFPMDELRRAIAIPPATLAKR